MNFSTGLITGVALTTYVGLLYKKHVEERTTLDLLNFNEFLRENDLHLEQKFSGAYKKENFILSDFLSREYRIADGSGKTVELPKIDNDLYYDKFGRIVIPKVSIHNYIVRNF